MARTILLNGQGTNTLYANYAATTSLYGVMQSAFFQDAGYTSGTLVLNISGTPTYNSTTGVVSIVVSPSPNPSLLAGNTIQVSGITGTGSFAAANGTFTLSSVSGGTTLNYTIATGLTLTFNAGGTVNQAQGSVNGAYAEFAFACVLSRVFHCVAQYTSSDPTLTTNVNIQGQVAPFSSATTGAGNMAAVSAPANLGNPSYHYDASDFDSIVAEQQIGLMQTLTQASAGPICPSLGVVCDAATSTFHSPFLFTMAGAVQGATYLNGPYYSHLGGNAGSTAGGAYTTTVDFAQDFCPGAFVARRLQWQPSVDGDTKGQTTCTFAYSPTSGTLGSTAGTPASLSATIAHAGALGIQHDVSDFVSVPAGYYCCTQWTGSVDSGTLRLGNAGVHILPAASDTTLLVTGCRDSGGLTWTGALSSNATQTLNTTFTTFGAPRDDKFYTENMVSIPTSGVFADLAFHTGSQAYGGAPAAFTMMSGPNSGETIVGAQASGTISATGISNFANVGSPASLGVSANAASRWFFDLTDVAAFTPFSTMLLSLFSTAPGSTGSVTMQAYSVNFTAAASGAGAGGGLLLRGVG